MKIRIRLLALFLCILMVLPMCMTAQALTPKHQTEADALYTLGLFKGTGTDANGKPIYELDAQATRMQGLVMLIRLLGEETDALAFTGSCPFTDIPAWARSYAAYAYAKGYTKGTSATTFGAEEPLQGKAYVTFVLRALGYDDAAGDFSYNDALTFGAQLGLHEANAHTGIIYRDDCAAISYAALSTNLKSGAKTLLDKLIDSGVVSADAAQSLPTGTVQVPVTITGSGPFKLTFVVGDICGVFPNAEYFDVSGWGGTTPAAFAQKDLSPMALLLDSGPVKESLGGPKYGVPPFSKRTAKGTNDVGYSGGNNMLNITVLDKDLNLLGYCVIAPQTDLTGVTSLTFTTCNVNGKEIIDRIKKNINSVKKIDPSVVYIEKIIETLPDGSEQSKMYFRLDEKNAPAALNNIKYYKIASGGDKAALVRHYTGLSNPIICTFGTDTVSTNVFRKRDPSFEKDFLYFLDGNMELLGILQLPDEVRMIETRVS